MPDTENEKFDAFLKEKLDIDVTPEIEQQLRGRFRKFQAHIYEQEPLKQPFSRILFQWRFALATCLVLIFSAVLYFSTDVYRSGHDPIVHRRLPANNTCIDPEKDIQCKPAIKGTAECLAFGLKECVNSTIALYAGNEKPMLQDINVKITQKKDLENNAPAMPEKERCTEFNVLVKFNKEVTLSEQKKLLDRISDNCKICVDYQDDICIAYNIQT